MSKTKIAALLLCAAISTSGIAAPPPDRGGGKGGGGKDPPAEFDPEYGGIRLGERRKPDQIVLKNADGSVEVVAYEGDDLRGIDLSIDVAGLISFLRNNTIYLLSWSNDGPFSASEATAIHANSGGLGPPNFSSDGTRIAFLEADEFGEAVLNICDIDPDTLSCEDFHPQTALLEWKLNYVHFHPDDNNKVVFSGSPPGVVTDGIYIHTLGDFAAPGSPVTQAFGGFDDVGPANGSNPAVILVNDSGIPRTFSLDDGSELAVSFDGFGFGYRLNCASDAVLYLETSGGKAHLSVAEFGGSTLKLSGKGWNINRGHAWMRKSDCQ